MEGLALRRSRPRRRRAVATRRPLIAATREDGRRSMRFCHGQLHDCRRLRVPAAVDRYAREASATDARGSFSAHDEIDEPDRLPRSHRGPPCSRDNGVEFASRALDAWACREDSRLGFSRPRTPLGDACIKSFDARLRAGRLNAHVLELFNDTENTLTSWRSDCNSVRPRSALGMLAPRRPGHRTSLNQARGIKAAAGPDSSQLE